MSYGTDWDKGGVETANLLKIGTQYLMYYAGYANIADLSGYAVGRAVSADFTTWQRPAASIFQGAEPSLLYEGGRYRMWWYRYDPPALQRGVYYSESADGVSAWSAPLLTLPWDYAVEGDTAAARVFRRPNGQLVMAVNSPGAKGTTSLATTADDGRSWNIVSRILNQGAAGAFDSLHANAGTLLEDNSAKLRFWYIGWKTDPPAAPDQHALGLAHEP